jgi:dipeptidyl aminopeptidase/acylaminoacyl peptidase
LYNNDDLVFGNMTRNMAASYTGCSPEENPALYDSLAPANAISASTPPTNIVLGASDAIVPPESTYEFEAALEKAGVVHQTVIMPYANHGFDAVDGNMGNRAYLDLSLRWFEQYLGA